MSSSETPSSGQNSGEKRHNPALVWMIVAIVAVIAAIALTVQRIFSGPSVNTALERAVSDIEAVAQQCKAAIGAGG